MQHNVSDIVVNQFSKTLGSLKALLVKAQEHAKDRKFDENNFLQMRLAPDMFPFVKQVQMTCDNAKGAVARLAGKPIPSFADDEKTIGELITRIEKTREFMKDFSSEHFSEYKAQKATFPWNPGPHLKGDDYLVTYAIPNFYFHATTCYAILRSNGVSLGKGDFLGELNWNK